jgi:hypothetical protein
MVFRSFMVAVVENVAGKGKESRGQPLLAECREPSGALSDVLRVTGRLAPFRLERELPSGSEWYTFTIAI